MSEDQELAKVRAAAAEAEMLKGNHWVLPSDLQLLNPIDNDIMARLQAVGFDQEQSLDKMLAIHEAIINAMKHGNKWQTDKKVKIDLNISAEQIEVEIEDEGEGFAADAPREPDPMGHTGRGLDIWIQPHFQVSHNEKGNKVKLFWKKQ